MIRIADPRQLTALGPARPLSERDFQAQVRDLARRCQWDLVFHAPSVLTMTERGWPDLVLVRVRDRRLIFAELKAERGRLTERQEEVLEILRSIADDDRCALAAAIREIAARRVAWTSPDSIPAHVIPVENPPQRRVEVHVWRPSDWDAIVEVLR